MKKFEHVNTISNIEFYFKYNNRLYLREQIHGSNNDQFTNHWYEVTSRGVWRLVKDDKTLKDLDENYKNWYEEKYDKKLA